MAKSKPVFEQSADRNNHYFASSLGQWKVSEDLDELIKQMKANGMSFVVYLVPLPLGADYEIRSYAPDAPGSVFIGRWSAY